MRSQMVKERSQIIVKRRICVIVGAKCVQSGKWKLKFSISLRPLVRKFNPVKRHNYQEFFQIV